ncbi:cation:proton antiporter family protein [Actinacidiphila yeochonensis]|uniref:hypothetical protein n=1 Tax=Actinacidiphila yeochonensis TaxID=89050 RepID=UPI0006904A94|nr:hypothetical protein [Actinacidiphila yeochonensis]
MTGVLRRAREALSGPLLLVVALTAVLAGFLVGHLVSTDRVVQAGWYLPASGLLLAAGLYGSTHEIDPRSVRADLRTALFVVTVGVLAKAAVIAAVMMLAFRKPEYLVLGITVAQIDPLSVAAMRDNSRMSQRAKSLLAVWAAFDDPMTVLLSLYFSAFAFHLAGRTGKPALVPDGGGAASFATGIGINLALCAGAVAAWWAVRWAGERRAAARAGRSAGAVRDGADLAARGRAADIAAVVIVLALLVIAAMTMLMLAVALTGLLVRVGRFRAWVDRAVTAAFLLAAAGLGVLLVGGVSPLKGVVLGVAAFGAQAVVALLTVPRMLPDLPRDDKVFLALGQQNGITAIILALALEPDFPGTVGVVGPAVLTVAVLYYAANGLAARRLRDRARASEVSETSEASEVSDASEAAGTAGTAEEPAAAHVHDPDLSGDADGLRPRHLVGLRRHSSGGHPEWSRW